MKKEIFKEEDAQGAAEYVLIASLVFVVIIATIKLFYPHIRMFVTKLLQQ